LIDNLTAAQVLIVDDEQDIRDGSARIISRMGCPVVTASRGEEAIDFIERQPVDIVLLDMKMPGMGGMAALARIREMKPSILVIVITGYATVETAIEAMKRGAYDFIPKPFEPDQLRIVVNRALERVRLSREAEQLEQQRRRTLRDLGTEKSRIRTILESLPNGVVVTDNKGEVVLTNPAFHQLLGRPVEKASGARIDDLLGDEGVCNLVMEISRGRHVDYDDIPSCEMAVSDDRYLMVRGQPVLGERGECLGAVVNLVDISAMKVLDRLKSEFVAKVSHELRSPLSTIHEQLALVLSDMVGGASDQEQHILSRAKEKTQGLISLIGDLLDLSRIEAGAICTEFKPVRIEDLLKGIADFLRTRADTRQQTLTLNLPDAPLPPISADPLALESIFGNLISNAIIYTPEGGAITVTAALAGINVRVTVSDNGFGIEAPHLEKIFERFYRVKNDKTRFITGTGLGLPIVKGLVDSLGGMITVESTPGQGSTFTVLLPVKEG
jgi:PAS domain S-box-containing protein